MTERTPEIMLAGRAAKFLGIHPKTLRRWNRDGVGPPRTLKGKRYWYARHAMLEWLKTGGAAVLLPRANGSLHQTPRAAPAGSWKHDRW